MPRPRHRHECPCCGYPTLDAPADYEICLLCDWEDDGQGEHDADVIRGGPNQGLSLSTARANFKAHRVMYAMGRDPRVGGGDSPTAFETKGLLMAAYEQARGKEPQAWGADIRRLERCLRQETARRIRAHERSLRERPSQPD